MDLNNINLDDIKEKISSLDRKTLIKFDNVFFYNFIFNNLSRNGIPIVDNKKIILNDQTVKLEETKKFKQEIKKIKKRILIIYLQKKKFKFISLESRSRGSL